MTRNINPNEGGPAGAQLEAKIGAYYLLALLGETEPRGMPGAVAQKVKFQRSYEGHAFDDVIVVGADAAGQPASLEIQAKRTLDFTAGDPKFAKVIAQIVRAGEAHAAPVAAAVNLGNRKIEREHHQLLQRARKLSSGADLRRALDAPRVMNQGMVAFANAVRDLIAAAGREATDEALWRVLRRLQILVFDFESPGALSVQLVEALCRAALGPTNAKRHGALWDALVVKVLSYDADGGEITRPELVDWLAREKGLAVEPANDLRRARQSFGDASDLALAAIDDSILGVSIDRSTRVAAVAEQLDNARFVEIKGRAGAGKSAILKALAERERIEGRPLVLTPARTPGGGWLTLSNQIGFRGTPNAFLTELAASGCTTLFIDGLDRITEAAAQATIVDLLWGCARTPGVRVAATVGYDFGEEQRSWIPQGLIAALGYGAVRIEALDDAEAAALAAANPRLGQLLLNPAAKDLTRNLYLLRRLVARASGNLPLTEAALAASWWEAAATLTPVETRARLMALRVLADQVLAGQTVLDLSGLDPAVTQRLVDLDEVDEQFSGSTGVFRHDTLRDWAAANLLREQPGRLDNLPLAAVAPVGLARVLEIYARWLVEQAGGETAWGELWARVREEGLVHGSWRRAVLLALVRSEQAPVVLDRVLPILQADDGKLLGVLISTTIAMDSEPAAGRLAAAGIAPDRVPADLRVPVGWAWARLMLWLLGRLDDITTPVGREILPFFKQWLVLNGGRDELSLLIVGTLHGWLMGLERRDDEDGAASFSRLFRYSGRYGADHGLGQDIRTLFLLSCARRPDLADAYLRHRIGERMDAEIASDVLMLGTTIAPAAPAALADFLIDALVTAEQRRAGRFGPRASGRLAFRGYTPMVAGPSSGPFLTLLRASKDDGLRAIRRIVDYGVGLDEAPGADPPQSFDLELDGRPLAIARPGAYFLPRMPGGDPLLASALRALEARGHEQIEAGRPIEDVVMEVLGDPDQAVAAPFLAVALDLLLSHLAAPDPRLIPFMVSPELLKLDFDRFTRDSTGINDLGGQGDDRGSGPPANADLAARRSRRTCLRWQAPGFLVRGDPAVLARLRQAWEAQCNRLKAAQDGPAGPQSLVWGVEEMLRLTEPANWTEVQVEVEDGRIEPRLSYVEPPEEAAILDPLRETSQADLAETVLQHLLVEAAINPDKATPDLVGQGLAWARAQPIADLREDQEDFLLASRWRALMAAAVLTVRSAGPAAREPWTAQVLQRAAAERATDHGAYGMAQLRYSGHGLAVLGLAHLAAHGDDDAFDHVLDVATTGTPAVLAAFRQVIGPLMEARPGCLASLVRLGLEASVSPWRDWDRPEAHDAAQTERAARLRRRREQEQFWLRGEGPPPPWPQLPEIRREKRRPGVALPVDPTAEADEAQATEAADAAVDRVLEVFNSQMAGAWLSLLEDAPSVFQTALPAEVVDAYRPLSNFLAGRGMDPAIELTSLTSAWLGPFLRLQLRAAAGLPWDRFKTAVLDDVLTFTDQGFCAAVEAVVPLADSLAVAGTLPVAVLEPFRAALGERLRRTRLWAWRKDEIADTLATNIAGAVLALFVHRPSPWGSFECRVPASAEALGPILPALAALAVDAPGSSYVATLLMNDLERAQAWAGPDLLATAAEAWWAKRGPDIHFWRQFEFGRRVCQWFLDRLEREALDAALLARVQTVADRLAEAGIPEAITLERQLATVQTQ